VSDPEDKSLRDTIVRRLLESRSEMPTSSLGRLGRTALTALRSRRLLDGRHPIEAGDTEALGDLVASVGQLKGIAMKIGQIFSYIDVALPEEVRAALSILQTHSPPMPFGSILQGKKALMKLRLPGEFLFLLRIRFGVMSVLARLGARANWYRIERDFAAAAGR